MVRVSNWYAIHVKPQQEFRVRDRLAPVAIAWVPSWTQTNRWTDRLKSIERPLFPGYVLASFDLSKAHLVRQTTGVVSILGFDQHPAPIPPAEIDTLLRVIHAGGRPEPCDYEPGQPVVVRSGPFCGIRGIVQRHKSGARLIVTIETLRRSIAVELDREDLALAA